MRTKTNTTDQNTTSYENNNRPLILHSGANGEYVGLLRLEWNVLTSDRIKIEAENLPLEEQQIQSQQDS